MKILVLASEEGCVCVQQEECCFVVGQEVAMMMKIDIEVNEVDSRYL